MELRLAEGLGVEGNIRLNEDLGFRVEGVLRNEVLIDGTYHDVLRMGLWAE